MLNYVIGMLLVILVIIGMLLFLATHITVKRFIRDSGMPPEKGVGVWLWRLLLLALVSYSVFLIAANREAISAYFPGPMVVVLAIALAIYFFAFIEIIVIDFFLPSSLPFLGRVAVEACVFILLCVLSWFLFNNGLAVISG